MMTDSTAENFQPLIIAFIASFYTIGKQRNLLTSGTILNPLMKFFQFQFGGLIISLKRMGSLESMKAKRAINGLDVFLYVFVS